MNELNEKVARELIENVMAGAEKAHLLAILTGDEDFKLLALMLVTMLQAQANGDIQDLAEAIGPVLARKIEERSGKPMAKDDLLRGFDNNLN